MTRVFVVVNNDGYLIRKSLIGMPEDIIDYEYMQSLLSNTLIMATMDIVRRVLPAHIAMVSRKSLLAENSTALANMVANIEHEDIGDISVMANDEVLEKMDELGLSYELIVVFPTDADLPDDLVSGKKCVKSEYCDKYTVNCYQQSVSDASDTQISDYIDGMESYFNMVDNLDKKDKTAIDKIVRGVQMLNKAINSESMDGNRMYDDGYGSAISEMDSDEEIERIWDTLQMVGDQMNDTTDLVLSNQETVAEILDFIKHKLPVHQISNRVNMLDKDLSGLRRQVGAHIAESASQKQAKHDPLIWALFAISGILLVLSVINLCI